MSKLNTPEPSKVRTGYRCMECDTVHEDYDDAMGCCPVEIREVFICATCDTVHVDEADAEGCCPAGDADEAESGPTPAELEAAGQQRLLP